nr:PPC domain-containing DNA-binding protein [Orenia marismortui]
MLKKYKVSNLYQGRLERGDDLLEKITEIINNAGIKLGRITAIGAVEKAKLSFYNQKKGL